MERRREVERTIPLPAHEEALPSPYRQALAGQSLAPLWTVLHALLPRTPATAAVPHCWLWRHVRPLVLEAARLVRIEEAERRVLVLCNPGLPGVHAATATLYAGLQVILPGESAPSHHHTPAALRLIVEGQGAYTTVEGVKCAMEPGDLVITPPMRWHDHGHEGREPVVWLDGLDIPLVRSLDASWVSATCPASPPRRPADSSQDEFTAAGLVPRRSRHTDPAYPLLRWPWQSVRRALATLAESTPAEAPVALRYVNPTTGRPPLPTMGAEAHWLRPGERTRPERRMASAVYHVVEGEGESRVGDERLAWERGDTFAAPPWHRIEHENQSGRPACLFRFDDEPALRALGLWQEEQP